MDSIDLTPDEIAQLVFEDFTHDAKVWEELELLTAGDVELTRVSTPTELVKDAELWYNVSTCMLKKAADRWKKSEALTVDCERGMARATSLLSGLESAMEQANYLLGDDDDLTKENTNPAKTVPRNCTKTMTKRKLRRKTAGVCVGFPQKGCVHVTSRMGPNGPQTLCNACGVRYLKQNKKIEKKRKNGNKNVVK